MKESFQNGGNRMAVWLSFSSIQSYTSGVPANLKNYTQNTWSLLLPVLQDGLLVEHNFSNRWLIG